MEMLQAGNVKVTCPQRLAARTTVLSLVHRRFSLISLRLGASTTEKGVSRYLGQTSADDIQGGEEIRLFVAGYIGWQEGYHRMGGSGWMIRIDCGRVRVEHNRDFI
jgi:hypothetical protein